MIVSQHISDYISSLDLDESKEIMELERWALANYVPIIRHDVQKLLRFMILKEKPKAILEIGAAIGFSALYMYQYIPADCTITTIEKVEMRLVHARKNLSGHDRIKLIEADAGAALKELAASGNKYDMIFLDAAKGRYMNWLPDILSMLRPGGMLLTDNVLLEGSIAESKFTIERRDRTIHMRMREYLYEITHHEKLDTLVLPLGDGLAISYLKGGKEDNE